MISLSSAKTSLAKIDINANVLDRDSKALQQALQYLGDRSLLALKASTSLGGAGFSKLEYGMWQIAIARYSGALAFLQTQHQSAGSFLSASDNQYLQQAYLPQMAKGKKLVGVGFSQLRRPGKPLVKAKVIKNGYLISGVVPWVTGGNIFEEFIVGATLPDGKELYGIVPLQNISQAVKGTIEVSLPMKLNAMSATNTVRVELSDWKLKSDRLVTIKPANSIHHNSLQNLLHHTWFPIGCAYSALDIMEKIYQKKQLSFILEIRQSLQQEIDNYLQQILDAIKIDNTTKEKKLKLRAGVIDLAFRCAQAAVVSASGAANTFNNDAGRVYREALVFSVSGQIIEVMKESLRNLTQEAKTIN